MARDYRQLMRGEGVWVPRWVLVLLMGGLAIWFGARIFLPPNWLVQQLDAPDGERSARLLRSVHMDHHFVVKLKDGWMWQTAYYSQPVTNDLRVDLGERLRWSDDSQRVRLFMEGEPVWGFDFERERKMTREELHARDE